MTPVKFSVLLNKIIIKTIEHTNGHGGVVLQSSDGIFYHLSSGLDCVCLMQAENEEDLVKNIGWWYNEENNK